MDRGAWWATVHRVAKSQIGLKATQHAVRQVPYSTSLQEVYLSN